jgi:hypothetical protein
MKKSDVTKLIELYLQISKCCDCNLPENCRPQIRPPGPDYKKGGIVFVQINPGFIGVMDKKETSKVYKTEKNRNIAEKKIIRTKEIMKSQDAFVQANSIESYTHFVDLVQKERDLWGWPPGKFKKTIEEHGDRLQLKDVAILNLAQCPVENNKFGKILSPCFEKWFLEQMNCLEPIALVAQGKVVFNFLNKVDLPKGLELIEGVHHAFRGSNEKKRGILKKARTRIEKLI